MPFLTDTDVWLCACAARLNELGVPCPVAETYDTMALDLHDLPTYRGLDPLVGANAYERAVQRLEAA